MILERFYFKQREVAGRNDLGTDVPAHNIQKRQTETG